MILNLKKQQVALILLLMTMLVFTGCQSKPAVDPSTVDEFDLSVYPHGDYFITPQDLNDMLGSEELVLLDCNKPDLYAKGHIDGAIGIGLHAFSDKIGKPGDPGWGTIKSKDDLEKTLVDLGIDNDKTVVLYSNVFKGPGADGRGAWQLRMAGLKNVKILLGGTTYWEEVGYELTSEEVPAPTPSAGITLKDYDESFRASKDEIFNKLGNELLIDVRTEKEFKGSQNAGEPRGGHIKGAEHILWTEFLNENGTLKSVEEIDAILGAFDVSKTDDFTLY